MEIIRYGLGPVQSYIVREIRITADYPRFDAARDGRVEVGDL